MMCWGQILLYSHLDRVLYASCVWILISCFRFGKFVAIILLKSLSLLNLFQLSSTLDSQVWSFGCIPDFLEVLVMFHNCFPFICVRVCCFLGFVLHKTHVCWGCFLVWFLFDQLFLWFLEFLFGHLSVFQFPCWIFLHALDFLLNVPAVFFPILDTILLRSWIDFLSLHNFIWVIWSLILFKSRNLHYFLRYFTILG